jgi:transcription elongation factor Elf1
MSTLKNKIAIMFVECDYCNNDGIINNNTYLNNKNNLHNIKCWNCEELYILDEDYIHEFFTV